MSKLLIVFIFICFLLINVLTADIVLSIVVDGNGIVDGISEAFDEANFAGAILVSVFRAIPYLILFLFLVQNKLNKSHAGKFALWFALVGIAALQAYGFWNVQYVLHTDQRVSSTHAISYIFIPLYSILSGFLLGLVGFLVGTARQANSK